MLKEFPKMTLAGELFPCVCFAPDPFESEARYSVADPPDNVLSQFIKPSIVFAFLGTAAAMLKDWYVELLLLVLNTDTARKLIALSSWFASPKYPLAVGQTLISADAVYPEGICPPPYTLGAAADVALVASTLCVLVVGLLIA